MKKSTIIGVILAVFVFASMLVVSANLETAEPVEPVDTQADPAPQPSCGSSECTAAGGCGGRCGGSCGVSSCGCGK